MNDKLFESILNEGNLKEENSGSKQLKTEEELLRALALKKTVYVRETGPCGEDEGATVVAFGPLKDVSDLIKVSEYELDDHFDCKTKEEFIADWGNVDTVVVSKSIGQDTLNFYLLDGGYTIEDFKLYI